MLIADAAGDLDTMVNRRIAGEPLEYILGWAEFCGLRIAVDAGVFVPRRRTELIVREAVSVAPPGAVIVDLCCGSAAVAAALATLADRAEIHAADVDPAAVRCARRNIPDGSVYQGDLYEPLPATLRGRIDILAVNAPYVPTEAIGMMPPEARLHEARVALDGGADGLDVHRRVAAAARQWLAPGGRLLIETSERQAAGTAGILTENGLSARVVSSDELSATVVIGRPEFVR